MEQYLEIIISASISIVSIISSAIISFLKTKQSAISKKVDKTLTTENLMSNYYIQIDDKKYYLNQLKIYKKEEKQNGQ